MPKIVRATSNEPPMMNFFRASAPRSPPPRTVAMPGKLSFSSRPLGSGASGFADEGRGQPSDGQNQQREDGGREAQDPNRAVHDGGRRRRGVAGGALHRRAHAEPS